MTLALVLAARKADPFKYDEGVDIFRGICEVLLFLSISYNVLVEVYQFKRYVGVATAILLHSDIYREFNLKGF